MSNAPYFYALAARVEAARTPQELGFVFCNQTRSLVDYRQASLVELASNRRPKLVAHSGLSDVDVNTPYAIWLSDVSARVREHCRGLSAEARVLALSPDMLGTELAAAWSEWLPSDVWVLPLVGPDGEPHALLFLARDTPWPNQLGPESPEFVLLQVANLYGFAWWALSAQPSRLGKWWKGVSTKRRARQIALVLVLLMLVPIREYTLVPAEVISTRSEVIASPRDGVIRRMKVLPNTPVKAGQVLAELDDVTLGNKLSVAQAELDTASMEMHQAAQQAMESQAAKGDLSVAEGKFREREVEVASLKTEIDKLTIKAPGDGVFVYTDPDEWAGRPVQTGERVGTLADPTHLGVRAWAPVGEPTNLAPGAPMTVFLRVAPLSPVDASLDYAGYETVDAPNGVASYLLRGSIAKPPADVRIGLQGTARVSGHWNVLGYLLLRRPLAAARTWCGC